MTDKIQFSQEGTIGVVTLTNEKALNALDLEMIQAFAPQLRAWAADPAITAVLVQGTGRAFCAGGDVRAVYESGRARAAGQGDGALTRDFFFEEYGLNHLIHTYPKPYIAIMDGITMGGGVGISVHGRYRVVTEHTVFAMPETGIGFFPDVGGTWFLNRCPGALGTYLALTGARLKEGDLMAAGIGTHEIPSRKLPALRRALADGQDPAEVLQALSENLAPPLLTAHRQQIDRCFGLDSVEEILQALEAERETAWAADTIATIKRMSPTSLKVTLAQLRLGRDLPFALSLAVEYDISQAMMRGHDFYEGIRAQLVDKDRQPKWQPATLAEVTGDMVRAHFSPAAPRRLELG